MKRRKDDEYIVVHTNFSDYNYTIQQAIGIARRIRDIDERALALANIVSKLAEIQPPSYVQQYFAEIMQLYQNVRNDAAKSIILATIGDCVAKLGDSPRAQSYIDQAFNIAQWIPEDGDRSWALKHIAKSGIFVAEGADGVLTQNIQKAINIANFITVDYYRASILGCIGECLAKMGEYEHADSVIKDGLKIAKKTDGERFRSRGFGTTILVSETKLESRLFESQRFRDSAIREIVIAIAKLGMHSSNIDRIEEAIALLNEIKDQSIKISALCEIATSVGMMGNIERATNMLVDALSNANKIPDDFYRVATLCNIASAFADIGDSRFVDGIIQQSIQIAYTITDDFHNSWALRKIVETLLTISQTTMDSRYITQSCDIAFWISNDKDYWYCARMIAETLVNIVTLPYELSKSIEKLATELENGKNEGLKHTEEIDERLANARTTFQNRQYQMTKRHLYRGNMLLRFLHTHRQLELRAEKEIKSLESLLKSLEGLDLKNAREIFAKVQTAFENNQPETALALAKDCYDAISAAKILGRTTLKILPLMSEQLVANVWSVAEVTVKNIGMTNITDISVQFTPPIEVLGTTTLPELKSGNEKKFVVSIKSKDIGKFPVKVVVTCKDEHKVQRTFESDKEIWVDVVKG